MSLISVLPAKLLLKATEEDKVGTQEAAVHLAAAEEISVNVVVKVLFTLIEHRMVLQAFFSAKVLPLNTMTHTHSPPRISDVRLMWPLAPVGVLEL